MLHLCLKIPLLNTNLVIIKDKSVIPIKLKINEPVVPFNTDLTNLLFSIKITPPNTSFYDVLKGIMINLLLLYKLFRFFQT